MTKAKMRPAGSTPQKRTMHTIAAVVSLSLPACEDVELLLLSKSDESDSDVSADDDTGDTGEAEDVEVVEDADDAGDTEDVEDDEARGDADDEDG